MTDGPVRILFVCLGNICRSPTGEGVMRALVRDAGLEDVIEVDSAGTGDWHVGHPPDPRSAAAAAARGVTLTGVARQVEVEDFDRFDRLVAMDRANQRDLLALAPDAAARGKVVLLRESDADAVASGELEVPDPYTGGPAGFDAVVAMVERACRGLLDDVRPHPPDSRGPIHDG